MNKGIGKKWLIIGVLLVFLTLGAALVHSAEVGQQLANVKIKDAEGNPAEIPDFGKKVLFIIYADSQTADTNDPVADALKAKKLDESKYRGMGIANLKDSWVPDFIIRMIIRRKIKQYNKTILTDDDHVLATEWGLGDCDDVSVVMVIGKDKKLKFIKKGAVRGALIQKVVKIVEAQIEKAAEQGG